MTTVSIPKFLKMYCSTPNTYSLLLIVGCDFKKRWPIGVVFVQVCATWFEDEQSVISFLNFA